MGVCKIITIQGIHLENVRVYPRDHLVGYTGSVMMGEKRIGTIKDFGAERHPEDLVILDKYADGFDNAVDVFDSNMQDDLSYTSLLRVVGDKRRSLIAVLLEHMNYASRYLPMLNHSYDRVFIATYFTDATDEYSKEVNGSLQILAVKGEKDKEEVLNQLGAEDNIPYNYILELKSLDDLSINF